GSDGSGNGCQCDREDNADPHSCQYYAGSQWQFHFEEKLPIGQAHPASGFNDRVIDSLDSCVSVANQWQKRVEGQGKYGQAPSALADPGCGQKKSEEREAWDCLNDIRCDDHRIVQCWLASDQDTEWDSNHHRQKRGDSNDPQMFECELKDLAAVLNHEAPEIHLPPRALATVSNA